MQTEHGLFSKSALRSLLEGFSSRKIVTLNDDKERPFQNRAYRDWSVPSLLLWD